MQLAIDGIQPDVGHEVLWVNLKLRFRKNPTAYLTALEEVFFKASLPSYSSSQKFCSV
jgi:hypothetical protein